MPSSAAPWPRPAAKHYAALAIEYAELEPIAAGIQDWRAAEQEAAGLREMIADPALERDMRALAEDELRELERRLPALELAVKVALLPKDEADARGAILEIRAGTGGEEAALFAGDLYRMYQRYAELRGWRFEPLSVSDTGRGGIKEVIVAIKGRGVFSRLKYEAGVHRVQRVPVTEASGRIHTSAATVAVLPEAEEVDVRIDESDLRIDVYRSSGPGRAVGQHHRQRGAHHAPADRHRGHAAGREVAAQEPGQGAEDPALAAVRARAHGAATPSAPPAARARSARATAPSASAPTTSRRTAAPITASI